ncbi:MAG: lipocalin family protein [Clostridia bacterium]|nr:lipocalin family protein [Clostridia bacterium]
MKKFAALLLALVLCLGVAVAETADIIGTWYLSEVVYQGVSYPPAMLGMDYTITFDENERATTVSGEETMSSYWALNGDKYITPLSDGLLVFAPQDGKLVGDLNGTQMIFVKAIELGAARTDATMADYNGKWSAALVDFLGTQMPIADMGTTMEITIADGKASMKEGLADGTEMAEEGTVTVENGVASFTVAGSDEVIAMQLHEGDVMVWVAEMAEGINMTTYFEKSAE